MQRCCVKVQVFVLTWRSVSVRRPEEVAEGLQEPILARVQREAGTPFDLCAGPLVRALLIRLAPEDHLLLLVMHHTVSDGWSFKVEIRDPPQRHAVEVA